MTTNDSVSQFKFPFSPHIEAERNPVQQAAPLHIVLPGGATLSLVHREQALLAAELIKALATPC
jgi:hypothetical protein